MSLPSLSPSSIMLLGRPPRIGRHSSSMWQATEGIFDALFVVGLLLVPIGFVALGVAMLGSPGLRQGLWQAERSARGGVVAASVLLVDPLSPSAFVGVLALIVFHLVLGWKLYSLSRVP